MGPTGNQAEKNRRQYTFNLTLAAVAGQVGCLTLIIVLAALFGGLWLDTRLDTKPTITVILMISSIPVTLIMMFWIVRSATSRLTTNQNDDTEKPQEEAQGGEF